MKNMKKLCLLALFVIFFAVVLSCASSGGAKAAGGQDTPTLVVGDWFAYSDADPGSGNNGSSTVKFTTGKETINGEEVMVCHVTGNVTTKYQYGFSGWGITADDKSFELYKTAKSLSFWILGDGQRYTIKFVISSVKDYGDYEYTFTTEKGVPKKIEVPMKYFMQPSWAKPVKMDQTLVTQVQWQTHESWRKAGNNNPFDIKIWGFTVYN
jgi:hypothetical protein